LVHGGRGLGHPPFATAFAVANREIAEVARVAIEAQAIGGPREVPAAMRAAVLQRTLAFAAAEVVSA
jgi:hypothetical protein